MDQDIDLREYIAALLKYKFWIVGLAVVAAAVALVVSLLLPPTYRATALVAITRPKYEMQFDPNFALVGGNVLPPYKAYPILATGDALLSALIVDLGDELAAGERTVEALRGMMEAKNGADQSIVQLTVENGDARRAAAIANRWAARFVEAANDLYAPNKDELAFYEAQQVEAEADLARAEQDLIDFQARNQAAILTSRLDDKRAALEETLAVARALRFIIQDAQALRERLRTQDAQTVASTSDELTALLLQIDALNRSELPIQLQIAVQQDLGSKTVGDQIAFLDSLVRVLDGKSDDLEREAQVFEPDILSLQERLQEEEMEEERLITVKDLALDTFMSLSRKVTEASIAAQDTVGDVRLASRATPPLNPSAPRMLLNVAVAGALGLLLGILSAFAIEFWQRGQTEGGAAD